MHILLVIEDSYTKSEDINSDKKKKKKHKSNRNKYYNSLWIKYTCRIITSL